MSRGAAEYWAERSRMAMERGMESADKVLAELRRAYAKAQRETQDAVRKLYADYATEQGMTLSDAQMYLDKGERKAWRYTLAEYVERVNATGDRELLRELNTLSARSRIRRLQQVETAVRTAAAELALGNGFVGRAAGFSIYLSNNLPSTLGKYKVIASYNGAASYAEQILSTEAYRMEKRFADAGESLHVYGGKVTRPGSIVVLTASFDSGILEPLTLTSTAGSGSGKTKVTVDMPMPTGYSAKVKTAASVPVPQYDAVLTTGWTAFTADTDITAPDGHDLVVAYVDGANKVKAAGKTTVTAAA